MKYRMLCLLLLWLLAFANGCVVYHFFEGIHQTNTPPRIYSIPPDLSTNH